VVRLLAKWLVKKPRRLEVNMIAFREDRWWGHWNYLRIDFNGGF
jgi:hypothetical protein